MDRPVTPDPDAVGETQRRSFIPAEDSPNFPAFLAAAFGQSVIANEVHTWEYRPTPIPPTPIPPTPPRVLISNRDGEVLHELPVTAMRITPREMQPVYSYDEFSALPLGVQRAAVEGSWDFSAAAGIEYGRALAEGLARGISRAQPEPTPEQRTAAAQWQREREAQQAQERATRAAAQERATTLLLSLLTPGQRKAYKETRVIKVRGSDKRRYLLTYGTVSNVKELNRAGTPVASWCAAPAGEDLPTEDVLAAQLLWLRADAAGFRAVANRTAQPQFWCRDNQGGYVRIGDLRRTLYEDDSRISGHWLVNP